MISNECIEAATSELDALGIPHHTEPRGKHVAIIWQNDGKQRSFVTAWTPSDWRAPLNVRRDIRRILREDGLLPDDGVVETQAQIVRLKNGRIFCDSRDISSHFGKAHKNVLRDIDRLADGLSDEFARLNFEPSDYIDQTGRKNRCFNLSRDGFTLLAMGFSGQSALDWKVRYLDAFNAMEREILAISGRNVIPSDMLQRIEKIEGDLNALIDLSLSTPSARPGYTVVKSHLRKVRAA